MRTNECILSFISLYTQDSTSQLADKTWSSSSSPVGSERLCKPTEGTEPFVRPHYKYPSNEIATYST